MVVPWSMVVRKAMMPMKNRESVRKRRSAIWSSSSTNSDSDKPTAPRRPDLRQEMMTAEPRHALVNLQTQGVRLSLRGVQASIAQCC